MTIEEKTIIFPAVFAKAVTRFNQIEFNEESQEIIKMELSKKIEPSMVDFEDNLWTKWAELQRRHLL